MSTTLFTNARLVLDHADKLTEPQQVMVDDSRIGYVGAEGPALYADRVIDVGGRTLMPGLIDAHAHVTGLSLSPRNLQATPDQIADAAAEYLRSALMDGFTTVREAGGGRGSGCPRHLRHGARVHRRGSSPLPAGGRAFHRARELRHRGDRRVDGRALSVLDPTFISLVQRVESAGQTGLSEDIVHNVTDAIQRGRTVYEWARKHGVPIALGTDLWGRKRAGASCGNWRFAPTWTRRATSSPQRPPSMPNFP